MVGAVGALVRDVAEVCGESVGHVVHDRPAVGAAVRRILGAAG